MFFALRTNPQAVKQPSVLALQYLCTAAARFVCSARFYKRLSVLQFFKKEVVILQQSKKLISLKQNHLFGLAYKKGKCFSCNTLAVYILKNRRADAKTMLGITVSKKRGKAVERNRAKRIIRAAFRTLYPQVKDGYIIVAVARSGCMNSTSAVVCSQLEEILKKAALLCGDAEKDYV